MARRKHRDGRVNTSSQATNNSKPPAPPIFELQAMERRVLMSGGDLSPQARLALNQFEQVYNTIEFDPSAGAMKGPRATEATRLGNAWDQAELLVSRFRSPGVGIPARYVWGRIDVKRQTLADWLNVESAAVEQVLSVAGLRPQAVGEHTQFDHIWVRAQVELDAGPTWVDLDPSWKFKDYRAGIPGIFQARPFARLDYLSQIRAETPYEYYAEQVQTHLTGRELGESLAEVPHDGAIIRKHFVEVPRQLPYEIVTASPPEEHIRPEQTHRVRITLKHAGTAGAEIFTRDFTVPTIADQPITIVYTGSGSSRTPRLYVGNDELATGGSLQKNSPVELRIQHKNADNADANGSDWDSDVSYGRPAWHTLGIALDARQLSAKTVAELQADVSARIRAIPAGQAVGPTYIDLVPALTGWKYFRAMQDQQRGLAGLADYVDLHRRVGSGVVTSDALGPADSYRWDLQIPVFSPLTTLDMKNWVIGPVARAGSPDITLQSPWHKFVTLSLHNASALEHDVLEETLNINAVSAVKGLAKARAASIPVWIIRNLTPAGPTVYSIDDGSSAANLMNWADFQESTSPQFRMQLESAVNNGATVTVPVGRLTFPGMAKGDLNWSGYVWIDEKQSASPDSHIQYGITGDHNVLLKGGYGYGRPEAPPPISFITNAPRGTSAGDPVNVYSGNMTHDEVDFTVPNIGIPLTFARHYDSMPPFEAQDPDGPGLLQAGWQPHSDRGLGGGWMHTYSDYLVVELGATTHKVTWFTHDGRKHVFEKAAAATEWNVPKELHGGFTSDANGFTYRERNGFAHRFLSYAGAPTYPISPVHPNGAHEARLTSIYDRNGNALALTYEPDRLTVSDSQEGSRKLTLDFYPNGHAWSKKLATVSDFATPATGTIPATPARTWQYEYEAVAGAPGQLFLKRVTAPDSGEAAALGTEYAYYPDELRRGMMSSITNANDAEDVHAFDYYPNKRAFSTTDSEGNTEYFSYDWRHSRTTYTNARGHSTQYTFNDKGLTTKTVNPDRTFIENEWYLTNPYLLKTSTDELGRKDGYTYDDKGNVDNHTAKDQIVTGYEYHTDFNGITKVTRADRVLSESFYTDEGDLREQHTYVTGTEKNVIQWKFANTNVENRGLPAQMRSPRHNAGEMSEFTTYTYNAAGQLLAERTVEDPSAPLFESVRDYDGRGNMVYMRDAAGVETRYTHDALGHQLSATVNPAGLALKTSQTYKDGKVEKNYDARENRPNHVAAPTETLEYDKMDRLSKRTDAHDEFEEFSYDEVGNLIRSIDKLKRVTHFVYDSRNRLTQTIHPDGGFERARYDGAGRIIEAVKPGPQPLNKFIGFDATTLGTWHGTYGSAGSLVVGDGEGPFPFDDHLPSGVTLTGRNDFGQYPWTPVVPQALQKHDPAQRSGDVWYSDPNPAAMTIDFDVDIPHQVAVYMVGMDVTPLVRHQRVELVDRISNQVLDSAQVNNLVSGRYALFTVEGEVTFRFTTTTGGNNSVVSGFLFDPVGAAPEPGAYDLDPTAVTTHVYDAGDRIAQTTDPVGQHTRYEYNDETQYGQKFLTAERFVPAGENEPVWTGVEYKRDLLGRVTQSRNPYVGQFETIQYDANGNVTEQARYLFNGATPAEPPTDPASKRATKTHFDALDRPVLVQNPLDYGTTLFSQELVYDGGTTRVRKTIDARGRATENVYDTAGRLKQVVQPDPVSGQPAGPGAPKTEYTLDENGNITAVLDPRQHTTRTVFDKLNRPTFFTNAKAPAGHMPFAGDGFSTFTQYDEAGQVKRALDEIGSVTLFDYDLRGRKISEKLPDPLTGGTTAESPTTTWAYDLAGNAVRMTDAVGAVTSYEHDPLGRVVRTIAPDPDGGGQGNLQRSPMTVNKYEHNDLVETIDPRGFTRFFTYDRAGRVIREETATQPAGTANPLPPEQVSEREYDSLGQVRWDKDGVGRATSYEYDKLGRMVKQVEPNAHHPLNHLGSTWTTYAYDRAGNLEYVTDPWGNALLNNRTELSAQFLRENLIHTTRTVYDELDRVTEQHQADPDHIGIDTQHNFVLSVDGLNEPPVTEFLDYDASGNLLLRRDPEDNRTSYEYDALGRTKVEKNEHDLLDGRAGWRTFYDAVGNVDYTIDRNDRVRDFTYDRLYRLTHEHWRGSVGGPSLRTMTFTYDKNSRRTRAEDPDSVGVWEYDRLGRASAVRSLNPSAPAVLWQQRFDASGNRTLLWSTIDGATYDLFNHAEYDHRDRLKTLRQFDRTTGHAAGLITIPTGDDNPVGTKRVDFTYHQDDQYDRVRRFSNLAGTRPVMNTEYAYDDAGRLSSLVHVDPTQDFKGISPKLYDYAYDAAGRIAKEHVHPGSRGVGGDGLFLYDYDANGQLVDGGLLDARTRWAYDDNGNRKSVTVGQTSTPYQPAGPDNRLTDDGVYEYEYDAEGNRTLRSKTGESSVYDWDWRNRLTGVTTTTTAAGVTSISYAYDTRDRLIARVVDGPGTSADTREWRVYDGEELALVFGEDAGGGGGVGVGLQGGGPEGGGGAEGAGPQVVRERFFHGGQVDEIFAEEHAATAVARWTLTDHLGSVRDIVLGATSSAGGATLINHVRYDTFGRLTAQTSPALRPRFQYAARESEFSTGLTYMRARWYDPRTGVFLSADPAEFDADNTYRYVFNDPIQYVDPSGLGRENTQTARPSGNWGVSTLLRGAGNAITQTLDAAMGRDASQYGAWHTLTGAQQGAYVNESAYVARQVRQDGWWQDNVITPLEVNSAEGQAIRGANASAYEAWARWNTGWRGSLSATGRVLRGAGEGAYIGAVANVNAAADTVVSTLTLGQHSAGELIGVSEWMRSDYGASYAFARGGYEILAGVGTGGLTAVKAGSTTVRVAGQIARAYDLVGSAVGVAEGSYDAYHAGVSWSNAAQIIGGGLGSASTIIRVPKSSNTNRLHQGAVHHIATDQGAKGEEFKALFDSVGLDLQSPYNRMRLPTHSGPHGIYNKFVYKRLSTAISSAAHGAGREALIHELKRIRSDIRYGGLDALLGAAASRAEQAFVRSGR